MDLVVGSRTFKSRRDLVQPSGEIHAVPASGFMQDRTRAKALCGANVIAFRGIKWPALYVAVDRECSRCNEALNKRCWPAAGNSVNLPGVGTPVLVIEVFVVMQEKQNPAREIVVGVCASRQRAERLVAAESRKGGKCHIVREPLLHWRGVGRWAIACE
jgi:hypothetical protein